MKSVEDSMIIRFPKNVLLCNVTVVHISEEEIMFKFSATLSSECFTVIMFRIYFIVGSWDSLLVENWTRD